MHNKTKDVRRTKRRSKHNTELHKLAKIGDVEGIVDLIESDKSAQINLDARNKWGETPLHYAIQKGNYTIIRILSNAGALNDTLDRDARLELIEIIKRDNKRLKEQVRKHRAERDSEDLTEIDEESSSFESEEASTDTRTPPALLRKLSWVDKVKSEESLDGSEEIPENSSESYRLICGKIPNGRKHKKEYVYEK